MIEHRRIHRFSADLPVSISTVLDSQEGRIVDISEGGAQIHGASLPKGTRLQIDWQETTLYAVVMWDEVDRMGVRFEFPVASGPLHDVIMRLKTNAEVRATFVPPSRLQNGFGRRFVA